MYLPSSFGNGGGNAVVSTSEVVWEDDPPAEFTADARAILYTLECTTWGRKHESCAWYLPDTATEAAVASAICESLPSSLIYIS